VTIESKSSYTSSPAGGRKGGGGGGGGGWVELGNPMPYKKFLACQVLANE